MARDAIRSRLRHLQTFFEMTCCPNADQFTEQRDGSADRERAPRWLREVKDSARAEKPKGHSHARQPCGKHLSHAPAAYPPTPSLRAARYRAGTSLRCGTDADSDRRTTDRVTPSQ